MFMTYHTEVAQTEEYMDSFLFKNLELTRRVDVVLEKRVKVDKNNILSIQSTCSDFKRLSLASKRSLVAAHSHVRRSFSAINLASSFLADAIWRSMPFRSDWERLWSSTTVV